MKSKSSSGGLVYSTDGGRICQECHNATASCTCASAPTTPPTDGVVRVSYETRGRGGKGVTVVKGFALNVAELTSVGKQLKAACGTGGTVKDGQVEVQGDHCEQIMTLLKAKGFVVKRSGG